MDAGTYTHACNFKVTVTNYEMKKTANECPHLPAPASHAAAAVAAPPAPAPAPPAPPAPPPLLLLLLKIQQFSPYLCLKSCPLY